MFYEIGVLVTTHTGMRKILVFITFIALLGCHKSDENKSLLESYLIKDKNENQEFQTVDFDCVILIHRTNEQIGEMVKDKNDIGDDSMWYKWRAIGMIDSAGIMKITATGQFLRLKGEREAWDLDIGKKNSPTGNLIFFKTNKEPKIVSIVDLTVDEVKEYFDKVKPKTSR